MEYKAVNKLYSPASATVSFGGMSGEISKAFFEKRFLSDFAKREIYGEAESFFRTQSDDDKYVGVWRGEFWGKQVLSAIEVYKITADASLLDFLHNAALTVISLAREDGYLNSYKDSLNVFAVDPEIAKEKCGISANWNWNIWCRKYTLWGLVGIYEITSDSRILNAAERLASQMIDELTANGIELRKTGVFNGLPSSSILKPLLLLYKYTANEKYLEYAKREIIDSWEREDGAAPNLIVNALSEKPVAEWYPNPESWAKAYEMISCFEGICEYYRHTGEARYLDAAEKFYGILLKYELNPIFSVGYNDMLINAREEINAISEPCDVIHFMRLCYELFSLTGDKKYMDSFELAYFNAFLAGVFRSGEYGSRGVRSSGRHMWNHQCKTLYQHCCVNNMGRAFGTYKDSAVMLCEGAVVLNFFEPIKIEFPYEGGKCEISVSDGYFIGSSFKIDCRFAGKPLGLRIRIPPWCPEASLSGAKFREECGWLVIDPEQSIEIIISFKTVPLICEFEGDIHRGLRSDYKINRFISDYAPGSVSEKLFLSEKRSTLTFGPLLLAKTKRLGLTEEEIFGGEKIDAGFSCKLTPVSCSESGVAAAFLCEFSKGEKNYEVLVSDFASAANEMIEDDSFYHTIYF